MDSKSITEFNEHSSSVISKKTQQIMAMLEESKRRFNQVVSPSLKAKNTNNSSSEPIEGNIAPNTLTLDSPLLEDDLEDCPTRGSTEIDSKEQMYAQGVRGNACAISKAQNENLETGYNLILPEKLYEEIEAVGIAKPLAGLTKEDSKGKGKMETLCTQGVCLNSSDGPAMIKRSIVPKTYGEAVKGNLMHNEASKPLWENVDTGVESKNYSIRASARSKMELKFVPHEYGSAVVDLIPDDKAMVRWTKCIVGYFVGTKLPFYDVKKEMFRQWNLGLKDMTRTENGHYFFEFHEENAMNEILDIGHCYVFGRVMVLKRWHQMLKLSKEAMDKIPVWVSLYDLPYEFWSADNLSKVASRLGKPLYVDQATENLLRVSYARVCIEIDASKDLQKSIPIRYGEEVIEVLVKYQWIPTRCETCKVFGHNIMTCPFKVNQTQTSKEYEILTRESKSSNGPIRNFTNQPNGQGERGRDLSRSQRWIPVQKLGVSSSFVTPNGDELGEETLVEKSGKTKLVDRKGNVSSIKDIKKKTSLLSKENYVYKLGNSFDILAGMGDKDMIARGSSMGNKVSTQGGESSKVSEPTGYVKFLSCTDSVSKPSGYVNSFETQNVDAKSTNANIMAIDVYNVEEGSDLCGNVNCVTKEEIPDETKNSLHSVLDCPDIGMGGGTYDHCKVEEKEKDLDLVMYMGESHQKAGEVVSEVPDMSLDEDVIVTPSTMKGGKCGLSYSDFPSGMSKKKKKKLMSVAMRVKASKKIMDEPP